MKKVPLFSNCRLNFFILSLFFLIFLQLVGLGHANAADPQLRAEIGSNQSYVILENSQIYVKYSTFFEHHDQFGIREFRIKSAGNENQVGSGLRYMEGGAGRSRLANASIIDNGTAKKTVRLVWYAWYKGNIDINKKITHEISIFPNSKYLKIDYLNVQYGVNIVDNAEPGGTSSGKHVAYGNSGWSRDYITHTNPLYHGSYYNRYPADGVYDPANGGSLNYYNHFIVGVYNPSNNRGFARSIPVSAISIIKLLFEPTTRRGIELFPYPFYKTHPAFTGYLYAVTGGESEILSVGKALAAGNTVPPPPPPPGTNYNLTANVMGGNGTVSPTSGTYAQGTRVTLTAKPISSAYCVLEWNGTDNDSSTSNTNTVTMNSDKNVTVMFSSSCGPTSYNLLKSSSPDRTSAVSLDGKTVSGEIYVFTSPDAGVDRVTFYLDGNSHKVENASPYDFEGTAGSLAIPFDTTTLNDGQHDIRAVMDLTGGGIEEVFATFTVSNSGGGGTGFYNLMVSSSPDRTSAVSLDGKTVSGDIYVFTSPDAGVDRVTFFLDGSSHKVENLPPYDFEGTEGSLAIPFDTTTLNDGQHQITAQIDLTDGSFEEVVATFTVGTGGSYNLLMSSSAARTNAVALAGKTVSGNIYVFTSPDAGVDRVTFYLDGSSHQVENFPPYDFEGTAGSLAIPFDTTTLNDGQHQIRAVINLADGGTKEVTSSFTVNN